MLWGTVGGNDSITTVGDTMVVFTGTLHIGSYWQHGATVHAHTTLQQTVMHKLWPGYMKVPVAALISQALVHPQLYKQPHCISSSCKSLSLLYSSTCAVLIARIAAAQLHAEVDLHPWPDGSSFAAPWRKKNTSVCKASIAWLGFNICQAHTAVVQTPAGTDAATLQYFMHSLWCHTVHLYMINEWSAAAHPSR